MEKQRQQKLIERTVEEVDVWMKKMQEIKESVASRPTGVSAGDFARRVIKVLDNCKDKMEAIKKEASKK